MSVKRLKEMDANNLPHLVKNSVWLAKMYQKENSAEAYKTEQTLLLTQHREALEKELPDVLEKKSARRFIACLDALRSMKDDEVDQMIEELVNQLCSNPKIACKGIMELVNRAGCE